MSSAGQFRDIVTFQDPSDAEDGSGGFARTFADGDSFFAKIARRHFSKRLENNKIEEGIEYFVTIKEPQPTDVLLKRIKIDEGARILEIISSKPTQDLDETEFRCQEVQADE